MNWIRFPEKYPPPGVDVLMFDGVRIRIGYWDQVSSMRGDWYDSSTDNIIGFVRYWNKLPEKPEE